MYRYWTKWGTHTHSRRVIWFQCFAVSPLEIPSQLAHIDQYWSHWAYCIHYYLCCHSAVVLFIDLVCSYWFKTQSFVLVNTWTHWPPGYFAVLLKVWLSSYRIVALSLAAKLLSCECHRTSLMRSQLWFREWLGVIRQQAITCGNVDPNMCRQMGSLGRNGIIPKQDDLHFADMFVCNL